MIDNVNQFIGSVAQTDLGKAARRSAKTIWNAHRAAFETTRHEAGRVFGLAIEEIRGTNGTKKSPRRRTRRAA